MRFLLMLLPLAVFGQIRWGGNLSSNPVSDVRGLPDRISDRGPVWEVRLGTHQYSIPTFADGRLYLGCNDSAIIREGYVPSGGGALICLDFESGRRLWEYPVPKYREGGHPPYYFDRWDCGICSGPLVVDGRVYSAIGQSPVYGPGKGCLTCYDAATGKVLWRTEKIDRTLLTPAVFDGILYLGDAAGRFHAFDALTGETLWTDELNGPARYGNPFVSDGKVHIGTERGEFRIYRAGRVRELLDVAKLPSPAMQCIAAEGALVIPMQNRISVWRKQ